MTPAPKPKRAYRYAVTGSSGSGVKSIGTSPFVLDWEYFGRDYTWQIYDLANMELTGWIEGRYVDQGWIVDGTYKTDAEMEPAAASPKRLAQ